MAKHMKNGGVYKMVEDGDVEFHKASGWVIVENEPQPRQDAVKPVSDKIVSVKKKPKK